MMNKHYILQAITADGKSAYIDDVPNGKTVTASVQNARED